jgi:hypothetical protein
VPQFPIAFAAFDDGNGAKLCAVGYRTVYRLDGSTWTAVIGEANYTVTSLLAFDDGSGPALFVGGMFSAIGDVPYSGIARWNGQQLDALQGGLGAYGTDYGGFAFALEVHDDGSGPSIFVGGRFTSAGGVPCSNLARWNGSAWSSVGGGVQAPSYPSILDMVVHDDGSGGGAQLVVCGDFTSAGGQPIQRLARWDGTGWDSLEGGVTETNTLLWPYPWVSALAVHDEGGGRGEDLIVGGNFQRAGSQRSSFLARRRSCGGDAATFCYGDGSGTACPCANESSNEDRAGCLHSFGTGGKLRADGRASLSADSLRLLGSSMTNSTALYFQGANVVNGGMGVPFGDGIRCVAGPFVRLAAKSNDGGDSVFPESADPSVSVRGLIASPGTRHYQVRYRNTAMFCTSATFNHTNGLTVVWGG